ncbi:uncharacterized protein si:ch211-67e16.4 isoform X1 [Dunckerocampus dactyliophorus]|uniref:uncharacterized protein si:ch211-67e16.4 isoform X1 n=1 Tax=Dunckerocampus dactyliophorus TaxID=161453 RepID=UPI002405A1B8|nr:uncharacterized protein si:ch211-67e16.4 isoform X1 [Dunckerocampus dactyliophorus]
MDISIAVSLIRGQMGAVVEQAVNGAVETVLAEMLKVVGVKFEELKAQLAHMKRDVVALQREKALKEKENDNIRAKLRYTELKLKYYRQGVEEELQHRASSSSSLVRGHPSKLSPGQTGGAGISSTGASPACSSQTLVVDDPAVRSTRECTSPQRASQHNNKAAAVFESADSLLAVSLPVSTEALESSDQDVPQENDWNVTVHDAAVAPPPAQTLTQQSSTVPPQADSSTAQVKMEEEEEEQQVICIKEEPEEEQEVMSCLLLDDQMNHGHMAQSEMSATQRLALEACQRKCSSGFSSAGPPTSYVASQPATSLPPIAPMPPGLPREMVRGPWTKDLSLYEEYKLRRNELRRRSLNRRRELEKTLPQPLLADLVRERREKTRLRVARWRAKRKLQACLNQVQTQGGAVALSQTAFPVRGPQQHRDPRVPTSSSLNNVVISAVTTFPFVTPSAPSLLLRGPDAAQVNQHGVLSSSATASYPQVGLAQQSVSLADANPSGFSGPL